MCCKGPSINIGPCAWANENCCFVDTPLVVRTVLLCWTCVVEMVERNVHTGSTCVLCSQAGATFGRGVAVWKRPPRTTACVCKRIATFGGFSSHYLETVNTDVLLHEWMPPKYAQEVLLRLFLAGHSKNITPSIWSLDCIDTMQVWCQTSQRLYFFDTQMTPCMT